VLANLNKGYKIKYKYESIVYHVGGATLQQVIQRKLLNFRNSLLMLSIYLKQVVSHTIHQNDFRWYCRNTIYFQGKFIHFTAILKAPLFLHFVISDL
jgi:hypothetical protein